MQPATSGQSPEYKAGIWWGVLSGNILESFPPLSNIFSPPTHVHAVISWTNTCQGFACFQAVLMNEATSVRLLFWGGINIASSRMCGHRSCRDIFYDPDKGEEARTYSCELYFYNNCCYTINPQMYRGDEIGDTL